MRLSFILIFTLAIVGCSTHNNRSSENISKVIDFEKTCFLIDGEQINWDLLGIQDFLIYDSLFIYSKRDSKGCIGVANTHGKKLGDFVSIGNGPNELLFAPWVNRFPVYKLGNYVYMQILDQMKGINYKMNITESINKDITKMEVERDSIPANSIYIPINDTTTFYCNLNTDNNKRQRIITIGGKIKESPHLNTLNDKFVDYGQDPNILSSIIKYSKENEKFVEISLMMNTMYIYDVNGDFFKTIYLGENLNDEKYVQRQKMAQRKLTFTNLRLYDDFWGVIYIDETLEQYDSGVRKPSRVLLFNWNGEPLADIVLKNQISSFDIDMQGKYLYTLDNKEEQLYRYKVQDILNDINLGLCEE